MIISLLGNKCCSATRTGELIELTHNVDTETITNMGHAVFSVLIFLTQIHFIPTHKALIYSIPFHCCPHVKGALLKQHNSQNTHFSPTTVICSLDLSTWKEATSRKA